jgi:hypothetical protein
MRPTLTCILAIGVLLVGCGHNDSDSQDTASGAASATPSPDVVLIAALANQQVFTLNNPWTQDDEDRMNVDASYVGPVFTTRIFEHDPRYGYGGYKDRYDECWADYRLGDQADGNRKCYPRLAAHYRTGTIEFGTCTLDFTVQRYGYYCGGGHGDNAESPKPRPMDPVDACCRYHDMGVWGARGPESNEEGIVMCLSMAKSNPTNLLSRGDMLNGASIAYIEEARQCWYDSAITSILGNQPDDAPAPQPY